MMRSVHGAVDAMICVAIAAVIFWLRDGFAKPPSGDVED
jgi:hypothetical protein